MLAYYRCQGPGMPLHSVNLVLAPPYPATADCLESVVTNLLSDPPHVVHVIVLSNTDHLTVFSHVRRDLNLFHFIQK